VTQADEWRELLEQANEVPGRVQVRPGAGAVLRARARRRTRRRTAAALAGALLFTVGGGLAAANMDALTGARVTDGQPASRSHGPAPGVIVGDLATPIEMHLVEQSGACPMDGGVPTWDGNECYRLGPLQMRILAVTRATFTQPAGSPTQPDAAVSDHPVIINVELTQADSATFADLTDRHVGQRIAVVVDNHVLGAPRITERIDSGVLLMPGPQPMIDWAAAQLTP
jgi:hypothetical protein